MPAVTVLPDVAKAVVDALTAAVVAGTFGQSFGVERSYADWELPLDDAGQGELRCDVVPVNDPKTELDGRGSLDYSVAVDLVLRKKLNTAEQVEETGRIGLSHIDDLIGLLLQIHEFFVVDRFGDSEEFAWQSCEVRAAYVAAHLREHRQYTGIVRIGFSTSREVGA